jgi:hypothetical protein
VIFSIACKQKEMPLKKLHNTRWILENINIQYNKQNIVQDTNLYYHHFAYCNLLYDEFKEDTILKVVIYGFAEYRFHVSLEDSSFSGGGISFRIKEFNDSILTLEYLATSAENRLFDFVDSSANIVYKFRSEDSYLKLGNGSKELIPKMDVTSTASSVACTYSFKDSLVSTYDSVKSTFYGAPPFTGLGHGYVYINRSNDTCFRAHFVSYVHNSIESKIPYCITVIDSKHVNGRIQQPSRLFFQLNKNPIEFIFMDEASLDCCNSNIYNRQNQSY